jgi:DNA primase
MEQNWPDRYNEQREKGQPEKQIFIDWIETAEGHQHRALFSTGEEGARVSMPIAWESSTTVAPDGVDMADRAFKIRGADPWRIFFFRTGQQLRQ